MWASKQSKGTKPKYDSKSLDSDNRADASKLEQRSAERLLEVEV